VDLRDFKENGLRSDRVTELTSLQPRGTSCSRKPRVALLTPYTGGNLGDAAIQDAVIANLRFRLPAAQFVGISLNNDNFVERHGMGAFPLCGSDGVFYGMDRGKLRDQSRDGEIPVRPSSRKRFNTTFIKRLLRRMPTLWRFLKNNYVLGKRIWRELRHCAGG